MKTIGQLCLLLTLVSSGYAAFVFLICSIRRDRPLGRAAAACGLTAFACVSTVVGILAWALLTRDFGYDYVARYSSQLLPWHYSLAAFWVGQAGSLLLWAWMLAACALLLHWLPTTDATIRDSAFGVLMAYLCFLVAILIFAADPLRGSLAIPKEGTGLSPLLQDPSMLIHPPVVFLAYALSAVPFALAMAALVRGRLDVAWTQMARPWALSAWTILGIGLLLGAHWAYRELGWGGYWSWDPVENGSLLPWLTGTALIHCLMAWRQRQCLKKAAVSFAILTFGLCNFATFLTRSGVFSSVHAFSESPIGWMFLALMAVLLLGGAALVALRCKQLVPERRAQSLWARESLVLVSTFLLLAFTLIVLAGTLVGPLSKHLVGHSVEIGPAFYNNALVPVGLLLLAVTAMVPLSRWGEAPGPKQTRVLFGCLAAAASALVLAYSLGIRQVLPLVVTGLAMAAASAFLGSICLDVSRRQQNGVRWPLIHAFREGRRYYAGYAAHLGFVILAVGITGSSLGSRRQEVLLKDGDVIQWADRQIHYRGLERRELPGMMVLEAVLEVTRAGCPTTVLRPARHLHLLQKEWTTEVDIESTWAGDFYTVLDAGLGDGQVAVTLVENPLVRWLWLGGIWISVSALVALWPSGHRRGSSAAETVSPRDGHDEPAHQDKTRRAA